MFAVLEPLLVVAGHTLVIYVFLVVGFSRIGRRQVAQLTSIDFLIIAVLGSAVETAMVAGNTSLLAGLVSAGTLLVANRVLTISLARSRRLRRVLLGSPVLLVNDGHILPTHLRRVGLTEEDVREAIRERGFADLSDVRFAVLEIDGAIGVVGMDAEIHQSAQVPDLPPADPSRPPR